ncbi:hypothetical protein IHQ71_30680 (plasmid) [Rhizobium sp. TH2]|uniref:hypothetical protein n=1 Tax=Rhizobium sp. TH2 TaxID=2775403 RepID=UPI002157E184|nr:hypothetical protein [Rhizobium sp. TH2]UVC12374.1 hypothetical protein IHQ71_30680 [Rhizobium sp. TH2]
MQSNLVMIWLLVTVVIFVHFAKPFDRDNPRQVIWLLVFAAIWPPLVACVAAAAIFTLIFLPAPRQSEK